MDPGPLTLLVGIALVTILCVGIFLTLRAVVGRRRRVERELREPGQPYPRARGDGPAPEDRPPGRGPVRSTTWRH